MIISPLSYCCIQGQRGYNLLKALRRSSSSFCIGTEQYTNGSAYSFSATLTPSGMVVMEDVPTRQGLCLGLGSQLH